MSKEKKSWEDIVAAEEFDEQAFQKLGKTDLQQMASFMIKSKKALTEDEKEAAMEDLRPQFEAKITDNLRATLEKQIQDKADADMKRLNNEKAVLDAKVNQLTADKQKLNDEKNDLDAIVTQLTTDKNTLLGDLDNVRTLLSEKEEAHKALLTRVDETSEGGNLLISKNTFLVITEPSMGLIKTHLSEKRSAEIKWDYWELDTVHKLKICETQCYDKIIVVMGINDMVNGSKPKDVIQVLKKFVDDVSVDSTEVIISQVPANQAPGLSTDIDILNFYIEKLNTEHQISIL